MAGLCQREFNYLQTSNEKHRFLSQFSGLVCQTLADQETGKDCFLIKAEEELEVHFKGERILLLFCFNFYLNY